MLGFADGCSFLYTTPKEEAAEILAAIKHSEEVNGFITPVQESILDRIYRDFNIE